MPTHHTFHRAWLSLSHPISMAALIVLLVNDHVLRRMSPSWLTGKLGDFAWLIFAPFLLAVILARLAPGRLRRRDEWIGRAAIIITGLVFALAKTVPAFHALTIKVLETLTGWPNILRLDPTDLIALPALLVAWRVWGQSATRSIHLPKRSWVLLPLAVMATMANSPAPDHGICGVKAVGSAITAGGSLISRDGGFTWQKGAVDYGDVCTFPIRTSAWQLTDPTDDQVRYLFTPGVSIQRSSDGGQSWTMELNLVGDDARLYYFQKTGRLYYSQPAGPFNAVYDQPTGNIVAAMGYEGVLVRTPDSVWRWVAVGEYHMPDLHQVENIVALLSGELLYALALLALMLGTLSRRLRPTPMRKRETLRMILVGLAWLGWSMAVVLFPPAPASGYASVIPMMATIAVAVLAVPMMLGQLKGMLFGNRPTLLPALSIATVSAVLFVLPYVVWSQGGIPFYQTAVLFALVLVAVTLIAGRAYLRRFLTNPSTPPGDPGGSAST
jgi:hypothetical protein